MMHRRREEGPLSLLWEHSSSKAGAGPEESTHTAHIAPRGTQKFAAKLERKYPQRERAPAQHPQHCPPWLGWTLHPPTHPSPFPVLFLPELKNDSETSAGQPVWDTAAGEALHALGSRLCRKSGHTRASSQSKAHSGTLGYFPLTGLWEKPTKTELEMLSGFRGLNSQP